MTSVAETRQIKSHPKLLHDVITRQAGSIEKAIMEAVMNSVDATRNTENPTCEITVHSDCIQVQDNGRGFQSRREIEDWFETFGQPHEESENKTYGTFRMGRGQLFAFGVNQWVSGEFRMRVDIKNEGLEYKLSSGQPQAPGCKVTIILYRELEPYYVNTIIQHLSGWCRYAPICLKINGVQISKDPKDEEWTIENDDMYFRGDISTFQLPIFNLGTYVADVIYQTPGVSGIIVTKKPLKVNFARNDIQHDCPVWKRIQETLIEYVGNTFGNLDKLTTEQLRGIWRKLGTRQIPINRKIPLFVDTSDRRYTVDDLLGKTLSKYQNRIAFADKYDRIADRAMQNRLALVLNENMIAWSGLNPNSIDSEKKFLELVKALCSAAGCYVGQITYMCYAELSSSINNDFKILEPSEYLVAEQFWVRLAKNYRYFMYPYNKTRVPVEERKSRQIVIGVSGIADGWTDGQSYIALNRDWVAKLKVDVGGITQLAVLLAHELSHDGPTTSVTHTHGVEFYELFHHFSVVGVPNFVQCVYKSLGTDLKYFSKTFSTKPNREIEKKKEILKFLEETGAALQASLV